MNTVKRWTSSVIASFDWMISQVENHEALVNAAIKEAQEATGRARVHLSRVKRDGDEMRKRLKERQEQEALWQERALRTADIDEKRALECVRRKMQAAKEIASLEEQQRKHAGLEKQLGQDLVQLDEQLTRLRQQRNLLRTRQSRAEALRSMQHGDAGLLTEIDNIFERWESKVSEYEVNGKFDDEPSDSLDHEFTSEEEERSLRDELARLKNATI